MAKYPGPGATSRTLLPLGSSEDTRQGQRFEFVQSLSRVGGVPFRDRAFHAHAFVSFGGCCFHWVVSLVNKILIIYGTLTDNVKPKTFGAHRSYAAGSAQVFGCRHSVQRESGG